MILRELQRIPAKVRNEEGMDAGNSEFAFGIETSLAGTPAMDKLWEYILKQENSHIHRNLAGNISRSKHLNDTDNWFFDNVLIPAIAEYRKEYPIRFIGSISTMIGSDHNIFSGNENAPFALSSLWVNFQRQHEFNPMHFHTGLFSFVVMMKIPYDWKEQYKLPHVEVSNSPSAGNLEFLYTDIMGNVTSLPYKLDSNCEGLMLFFPASTRHIVILFMSVKKIG